MPPPDNHSPSASSIFLPLGRRSHNSKSSASRDFDQEALSQALHNIHSAASQTSDLTVFNDYTEPPPVPVEAEGKGLASELHDGLAGLYNKFRATVGAGKESTGHSDLHNQDVLHFEKPVNQTASGKTSRVQSRVQSPRIAPSESTHPTELSLQGSRLSLKNPGLPKPPVPLTPILKSPSGPPRLPTHLVGPAVTELTIHAANGPKGHSRQESGPFSDDGTRTDRSLTPSMDESGLQKVLSRTDHDSKPTWQERRIASPQVVNTVADSRHFMGGHERGLSDHSISSQISKSNHKLRPTSPLQRDEERNTERIANHKHESSIDRTINPNSQQTTSDHQLDTQSRTNTLEVPKTGEGSSSPKSALPIKMNDKLLSRVSQSRLPGFSASRASSTDSGYTKATLAETQSAATALNDGAGDEIQQSYYPRPPTKLRSKLLSKEFWMRDENARDCFRCGEPFTTFRRKHHCRMCGQIFDNKCTTLLSGSFFGAPSAVRVCRPCEAIITSHDDDSSDYSIEEGVNDTQAIPRTPEVLPGIPRLDDDNISIMSQPLDQILKTPTMSFPVRRAYEGGNRSSAILEFDTSNRTLPRPSSSRSLRTSHSIGHGHKRHHSRHQHIRNVKAYHEERAPFQQRRTTDDLRETKQSAFHRDSIIDPDLAQYLSDEASSDDQYPAAEIDQQEKYPEVNRDNERLTIGGLIAAVRKGRSRIGDRSIAGFLSLNKESDDAASIVSSRAIERPQMGRKRNLSVASSVHHRITPRATRERLHVTIQDNINPDHIPSPIPAQKRSRMIRSASMHGTGAPSLELNRASMQHVQKLLKQLLTDADVPKVASWEDALIPILLRATDDVDPDVQDGDDIDIRNYVKLKKIPGGKPHDTSYISGLVFTKNVALKSMARLIPNPRILIVTFALEYARHEQHFMSLDPVIRQEKEYLENVVGRIAALKPDVLLAQRNVSGRALELLEKAKIATVYNVKSAVLEAVSRCTQTRVANSMDKLGLLPEQLGTCDSFEVKTFVADGRRKTYIYLSGCAPHLGCTIALRGADKRVLAKIKSITDFMVYVVYNLKLETCLMRDEWALIPSLNEDQSTKGSNKSRRVKSIDNYLDVKELRVQPSLSAGIAEVPSNEDSKEQQKEGLRKSVSGVDEDTADIPDDIPVPMFYEDLVEKHQTKIVSASPFVKFAQPYLLMRARELERRVAYLKRLRDQDMTSSETSTEEKSKSQKFTLIQPEMVHSSLAGASRKVREIIHAVHDTEYDKALHNYETQKKQWEAHISGTRNLFDPYAHQNIVVLFSQVSTATSVPCSGPDLLAFSFYNEHENDKQFEADCTLGQFVEDLCYRANDDCSSEACEKRLYEHHRQYVHGEAQVTVFLQPYPAKMRGLQDIILMWSQCKICGVETTVTPMSPSTWKYSFGKYLELSFWSADLHARAGICPHDLHRDHLRFFGYKDFALRIQYDPVELLELVVPRMRITWKVDNDLRFRNELFTKIEHRITKFMISIKLRLKSINIDAVLPEIVEACKAEIESLTKRANEDHTMLIKHLQERYTNSRHWEVIPLNRALRLTQEKVADWDIAFADFERNYFPSERDIRRLATIQLKKIFLDRDVSVTTLGSGEDGTVTPTAGDDEKLSDDQEKKSQKLELSSEKTQTVLQSVLEEHGSPETKQSVEMSSLLAANNKEDDNQDEKPLTGANENTGLDLPEVPGGHRNTEDVQHLDLAIPQIDQPNSPPSAMVNTLVQVVPTISNELPTTGIQNSQDELSAITTSDSTLSQSDSLSQVLATPQEIPSISALQALINRPRSPVLLRAQSQPAGSLMFKDTLQSNSGTLSAINAMNGFGSTSGKVSSPSTTKTQTGQDVGEESSEKSRFSTLKSKFAKGQSFIPRAIASRKDSRVSNLAKHFEQLSREFERERVRERKLRAARSRQSRVYPLAVSRPIVEVYKDVNEAVDEDDPTESLFDHSEEIPEATNHTMDTAQGMAETAPDQTTGDTYHTEEPPVLVTETETETEIQHSSHAPSEADDHSTDEDSEDIHLPDSPEDLLRLSQEDIDLKELPKHERTSLMKMLTNFWAERSSSGWSPLEYPLSASDHIFADCDIIVREDEPSSIIAFALDSHDYKSMLHDIQDHPLGQDLQTDGGVDSSQLQPDVMHSLLRKTGTHLRYQFEEGPAKMLCKIFYAEQFDAMRRRCGVADRFVESMSRCLKWDSKGGKTKSVFLKTLDDRFVLKSLLPVERESFLKFAPNYFQIMSEAFFHELPSVIAKMLGFYQIIIKNPVTGVEYNWSLLVMENLFYDRVPTRIFDLKGSMRNRKINVTGERNEVLLDENMVDFIYESPLFAREHSKKLLRSSVHNDTLFLARQNVMDYSLMIAIDEVRKELVVGIIDCIRTYTWDKKLESWIKDRGFAGGGKNRPTVTSPKEYKRRFREAMNRYVLEAPSCWYQFKAGKMDKLLLRMDGGDGGEKGENELQTMT